MKYLILLFLFVQHLSLFSQKQESAIELHISILKNKDHKIRQILWFDKTYLQGDELAKNVNQSVKITIPNNKEIGILRIMISSLHYYEYLIYPNGNLFLEQSEELLTLKSSDSNYSKYDLSVDSLLRNRLYRHQDPVKKYFHPDQLVDWGKKNAPEAEATIKKKALVETEHYFPKVKVFLDSLKYIGQLSVSVADFYSNKNALQQHQIALLEGRYDEPRIKEILQGYLAKEVRFPNRYLYKFTELAISQLYVIPSPKMYFNDGINRDYRVVYDKISNSKLLPDNFKHEILSYYLTGIVHSFPIKEALPYYQKAMSEVKDSLLIKRIKDENYAKLFPSNATNMLEDTYSKSLRFKDLTLSDYPILYIDFWASWCGPCRAEMPASLQLKESYQSKGVGFVYISTDTNPSAWRKAIVQLGLNEKNNYRILDEKHFILANKYKIKSIPRYIIMSKDGKILNPDAPRPSDPNVRKILDDFLKKR